MPRALKEKAVLFNDIEKFLMSKGAAGAKAYEIAEHLKAIGWANLQSHQISHALGTMRDLHHVSKWKGQGRGDSWVSKKAQEIANKGQVGKVERRPAGKSRLQPLDYLVPRISIHAIKIARNPISP